MVVVPLEGVWVTANFKETQLRRMKIGQPVTIKVDAFDREYTGKVLRFAGASGAKFSILPPENATGNFVKVVQRVPVRIAFDPGQNEDHRAATGNVGGAIGSGSINEYNRSITGSAHRGVEAET